MSLWRGLLTRERMIEMMERKINKVIFIDFVFNYADVNLSLINYK